MMDLATINALSREAAVKAAKQKRIPFVPTEGDVIRFRERPYSPGFSIPNLGDYRPKGWTLKRQLFVDSSGFGSEGEPAMTIEAFAREMQAGLGYATTQQGEFQVYVGEFEPPKRGK